MTENTLVVGTSHMPLISDKIIQGNVIDPGLLLFCLWLVFIVFVGGCICRLAKAWRA